MKEKAKGGIVVVGLTILVWLSWIYVFQQSWNYVMPHLLQLPTIDYIQALALAVVIDVLGGLFRKSEASNK